jgi:hypothetical protein
MGNMHQFTSKLSIKDAIAIFQLQKLALIKSFPYRTLAIISSQSAIAKTYLKKEKGKKLGDLM